MNRRWAVRSTAAVAVLSALAGALVVAVPARGARSGASPVAAPAALEGPVGIPGTASPSWAPGGRAAASAPPSSPGGAAPPSPGSTPAVRVLAQTPPMGWDGYNYFGRRVNAAIVKAEARALVASGMRAAGYTYVVLDGGWALPTRDARGNLQADPSLFPQGIAPLAAYVHSLGLKFGIYASAGTTNCAGTSAGSYGHYPQDAATFASWGVDYVKLDWCHIPLRRFANMTHRQMSQTLAAQMGAALAATGRPILYDVNDTNPRVDSTWTWAARTANVWRTVPDIRDSYTSMVWHFTHNIGLNRYAAPGRWNDPDMLEVGNGGMSTTEYRTQLSLWAEMAAPLIAGNDLTSMSAVTRSILTNRGVIAVDQDRLGAPGYVVASAHGRWVLTRRLAGGDRAVVLFNQTDAPAAISTTALQVGLGSAPRYRLRDLWTGRVTGSSGAITATVPAHGVAMYRVSAGR